MHIDEELLTKLKCAKCFLLLSVGPITTSTHSGYICGRCNNGGTPITIYEVLAQKFAFPCRYRLYGCQEVLKWGSVKAHEQNCTNIPCPCPSVVTKICGWTGSPTGIAKHFKGSHPEDVMDADLAIELKLNKNVLFYKLVKTKYGEYIFYLSYNKAKKELDYNVMQLVESNAFQEHNYQIKINTHDVSKKITLTGHVQPYGLKHDNNTVDENLLKFLTSDGLSIFCKLILNKEKSKDKVDLLQLLECPVCKECMGPPIYQCITGHSFCYPCTTKLDDCALCHGEFTKTRNYVLEGLANQTSNYCKNNHLGCTYNGVIEDVNDHEKTCGFYRCPLEASQNCKWGGELPYLIAHCKSSHQWLETENYGRVSNLTVDKFGMFRLIYSDGMFFRLCRKYENEQFCVVVQFVGPSNTAATYSYEFSFIAMNNNKARLSVQDVCQAFTEDKDAFCSGYQIPYSLLEHLVKNNKFKYDLKIIKK